MIPVGINLCEPDVLLNRNNICSLSKLPLEKHQFLLYLCYNVSLVLLRMTITSLSV